MSETNDRGPLTLKVPGDLGARILKICHDQGVNANEATAMLWQRALRRGGSIIGEDTPEFPTAPDEPAADRQEKE